MNLLKKCSSCKEELDIALFNKRKRCKDGLQHQCKTCQRAGQNAYYARNGRYKRSVKDSAIKIKAAKRDRVFDILRKSHCVHCGESDPMVLSFDHIDPGTKKSEVGTLVSQGYAWATIEFEIAKCQILCFNCHIRKTAREMNWHRATYVKDVDKS